MKPKNKLMNKKGQISSVLSGIFSGVGNFFKGIGDGIKSVIDIIPKPIKIVLFLLLILLLGNFINLGIRYFGIQCNSGNTPMKITNLLKNTELIGQTPDYESLNLYGSLVSKNFVVTGAGGKCSFYYGDDPNKNKIKFVRDDTISITNPRYFYISNCVYCPDGEVHIKNYFDESDDSILAWQPTTYCYGNAYNNYNKTLIEKASCDWFKTDPAANCQIPEGYYYDSINNIYVCLPNDPNCKNITIGERWNEILNASGAVLLYPLDINISDNQGIKRAVGITCPKGTLNPRLGVFGIDIFDYTYWILGLVIAVLVWVAINLKKL